MKRKTMIISGICGIFLLAAFAFKYHSETYKIDSAGSSVEWYAAKLTGNHNGTIAVSGGEVKNEHGKISGFIEMDMTSIKNKDIESEQYRTKLEKHLMSEDFFNAAKYPKSKFVITSVTPVRDSDTPGVTHQIKGLMTIKDKTNEVTFYASFKMEGEKLLCSGEMAIDRSKFDVKYGSKTFFADIGDKIIYDEFTLKFNIVGVK